MPTTCQSNANSLTIRLSNFTRTMSKTPSANHKKNHHRWTVIRHALTKVTPIQGSILVTNSYLTWEQVYWRGPTEVSRRRKISQTLSIRCKSCAIPSPIHTDSRTWIGTQLAKVTPIHCHSIRTLYRDLMELVLWRTHRSVSGRHHSQLTADPPIRSIANAVINHCQSNTNPMSIWCQSYANSICNLITIRADPSPIWYRSMPIIYQSIAKPISIITNTPIQCKTRYFNTNPPPIPEQSQANLPKPIR